ncbi:MAG: 2-oxoglutarate dehydrogenase complex dihydrolipoyllysine-residue succinyltransferase [Caldilineaceae bacterium]
MAFEIKVPTLGESIVEGTISKWLKKVGDPVAIGDALVELETDKINLEVPAEQAGVLTAINKQDGENVAVGEVLGTIDTEGATLAAPEPSQDGASAPQSTPSPSKPQDATPVAQRAAAEHHVDLQSVTGSGPGGRVTKDDVLRSVKPAEAEVRSQESVSSTPQSAIVSRPEERIRMSRRRQTIARRLVEAQQTAAMLTTFNEVDMSKIMEMRKRRKESFQERHGVGLGFMSFFTKAVIGALKQFPMLNAEIQGDEFLLKKYYDIGIAVGTEEGLVVPVLRDADRKSFAQIEREIGELAKKAREGTLGLNDLQGGTFTITNGGVYGSLMSTPILNTPQVGILGMHKIEERPIAIKGEVVIRPMMYLALSYDHRIVDGSESVRFLVKVKELIEDPEMLLLEG